MLSNEVQRGAVFSGWVFHPSQRKGGPTTRLALEDKSFSGYGFCLTNKCTTLWIERRDNQKAELIGHKKSVNLACDTWYKFALHIGCDEYVSLYLYDDSGRELEKIESVIDNNYKSFDRVAVHGGAHFYIDDITVTHI